MFGVFARELRIESRQAELLAHNRDLSIDLVAEVDGLVIAAQASAAAATDASSSAIFTGRTLLLVISGVSIVGAVLIIWLYLGRILLRRLNMLSNWMLRMAGGDLETSVEMEGQDEVAEMAAALEVFRRHALEVQRLNLVEQLATELQGKNVELESTLGALHKAQDQIVMREKLAGLGELTAGVAHEIRNPLNFVNNFSEVSVELLVELQEVLEEEGVELSEEQKSLVAEITGDLTSNLGRISSHGQRRTGSWKICCAWGEVRGRRSAPTSTRCSRSTRGLPTTARGRPTPTSSSTSGKSSTRRWASSMSSRRIWAACS